MNAPQKQPLEDQAAQTPPPRKEASQQTIYNQPKLTSELLQRIAQSNEKVLKKLAIAHTHNLPVESQPKDLHSLAVLGANNSKLAWPAWLALWKELTSSSASKRPPILLALDGINSWMTLTKYRSPEYNPIHAHQFAPIRRFLDIIFNKDGAGELANGGMILAARTSSNSPAVPTFELLMKQLQARQQGIKPSDPGFPLPEAYMKIDQRVLDLLPGSEGLEVQKLQGLERDTEAKGLLEYFAKSGVMRESVTRRMVNEKWTLAGGGVVGEMARFGQRLGVV
jgi:small subunit ribosomal protein S29